MYEEMSHARDLVSSLVDEGLQFFCRSLEMKEEEDGQRNREGENKIEHKSEWNVRQKNSFADFAAWEACTVFLFLREMNHVGGHILYSEIHYPGETNFQNLVQGFSKACL